jgi:hypothetical protein
MILFMPGQIGELFREDATMKMERLAALSLRVLN